MKENKIPYELCKNVLERLQQAGILKDMILIGSWCIFFYKNYFTGQVDLPPLRTRDIDFLINIPPRFNTKVDIAELLKDLGFIVEFSPTGSMRLSHPELIIDFIVPEKGRKTEKPYNIKALSIMAQRLRFTDLLTLKPIQVNMANLKLYLPDPILFSFHKLIVSTRRADREKKKKDIAQAMAILQIIIEKGKADDIRKEFELLPKRWKNKIIQTLTEQDAIEIKSLLT